MRTTIRLVVITAIFLFACAAFSQNASVFHVKSIHKETPDEHGTDKGSLLRYLKMVGTFEGKTYTIESMDAGWTEALEVGKDYPATLKKSGRLLPTGLIIESTFKGRAEKTRWDILTVEE
jgi:hypothetical protein